VRREALLDRRLDPLVGHAIWLVGHIGHSLSGGDPLGLFAYYRIKVPCACAASSIETDIAAAESQASSVRLSRHVVRRSWPSRCAFNFHWDNGAADLPGSDVARHFSELATLWNRLASFYSRPHAFAR
jgi:hypothetical protein